MVPNKRAFKILTKITPSVMALVTFWPQLTSHGRWNPLIETFPEVIWAITSRFNAKYQDESITVFILLSIWHEIGHFVGYKFRLNLFFCKSSSWAILVDIFWHEIRRSNFEWFQIGIDQTMKQVIPEMILIWRAEIYNGLPFILRQLGFIQSLKISNLLSRDLPIFWVVFVDFAG